MTGELTGRLSSKRSGDGGVMFHAPIAMARLGSLSASRAEEMVFLESYLLKTSWCVRFGEEVEALIIVIFDFRMNSYLPLGSANLPA